MSNIELDAPIEIDQIQDASPAEVEDPIGFDGEVGDVGEPFEQPNVLNLDEYNDYVVDIGGEFVPVAELKGGGLRQQDYTRKTQEVAELRRENERALTLDRALQVNPEGTLQYLAQQHGMTLTQAQAAVNAAQGSDDWWDDSPQPSSLEREVAEIRAWKQQQDAERQITAVFNGLKAKYEDFNEQEVAQAATQRGIYDPNLLEMVYRDLAYGKITQARTSAQTEAAARAAAEDQRRRQAAASAAASTGATGGSIGAGAPPAPSKNLTVREAAELAWAQLGLE